MPIATMSDSTVTLSQRGGSGSALPLRGGATSDQSAARPVCGGTMRPVTKVLRASATKATSVAHPPTHSAIVTHNGGSDRLIPWVSGRAYGAGSGAAVDGDGASDSASCTRGIAV